jgi:hypothetical protein
MAIRSGTEKINPHHRFPVFIFFYVNDKFDEPFSMVNTVRWRKNTDYAAEML